MGPYNTLQGIYAEAMPREVRWLHDTNQVRSGDPDRLVRDTILGHMLVACEESGVQLGDQDRRTLSGFAGMEPHTAQVVIGLIRRAYAAGDEHGHACARQNDL